MDQLIDQVRGYSFGRMSYLKGGIFGPIQRPYLSLLFVEKGCCAMRSDAGSVTVLPGQVGFLAGTGQFEFRYQAGTETIASWCEGFLPGSRQRAGAGPIRALFFNGSFSAPEDPSGDRSGHGPLTPPLI